MNDPSEEFRYSLSLFLTDKFTRLKKSSKQFLTIMMCKRRLTPEPDPMITLKNCAFYILMSFYAVQCGTIFCHQLIVFLSHYDAHNELRICLASRFEISLSCDCK